MATQQFWFNLPVKDLEKSKEFFRAIGFRENPRHGNSPAMGSFFIGAQKTVMMLFPQDVVKGYMGTDVSDTSKGCEVLFNIDAQSPIEVDEMAERVRKASGTVYAEPGESQGWMYGFGFIDLDGHRWSMLYMDMEKMPKQQLA